GSYTAPAFADLDDDGDLDMVLATAGNHYERADTSDFLVYYENVGDSSSPKFKLMNDDYLGFKSMSYQGLVPSFADIDGDEDLDLFFGNRNGSIMYYENGGAKSAASFTYKTDTFLGIKVQSSSAPSFYDMNKDGKLDLLLGSYGGNIEYHENTGTSTSPAFTLMEDTLGGILVNELIKQNILGPDGFRDTFIHLYYGYSSPQVVSWGNGALCLAVGGDEGLVRVFDINSDLSTYFEENTDYMKTSVTKTDYIKDWGSRIRPASADLNGDGVSDLMIGLSRGGLQYMEGIEDAKTGNITSQKLESFNVYPNPTDGSVTIFASSKGMLHYEIMDLSGKILREGNTISGQSSDMASSLKNGVYFITLKEGNRQFATQKLVVAR
ncbi:MAG: T9SS type A sorting domain-containing protein, partial [Bacteroidia bacterium]